MLTLAEIANGTAFETPEDAFARAADLYESALARLADDFHRFQQSHTPPDGPPATYPFIAVDVPPDAIAGETLLSYGRLSRPGIYAATLTEPRLFRRYYLSQMRELQANHGCKLIVGPSATPIPLPFAIPQADGGLTPETLAAARAIFPLPDLAAIDDEIANGTYRAKPGRARPLALFSADRVDFSLKRLRHYTGTSPEHFQSFVLFTNYQRYVDEFIAFARASVAAGKSRAFVEPGDRITRPGEAPPPPLPKLPQMPAYHLIGEKGDGITLVNIGVGPSNAKTITDHIAVLRPHCWLMIGHCGGLRESQRLGDYVLAHAYVRFDGVLDRDLPQWVPLPSIAEVQLALQQAVGEATGLAGWDVKRRLRTGTVVTTADRNWELRYEELAVQLNQARAIAIDMESATIAANGYRFRVPYGTLLCVSDRPLHGEMKLPGMADAFYQQSVSQHLQIGLRALDILRGEVDRDTLHSRKLRSADEPAFR
jgi:AMP nucleosidase